MAVNINVPSQVKTYANLAAFPASGALKTIYIAEDTNKTYRWTGSVYVEVSAAGASGITIGTTAITSGTVGRVLFEGTGNVVQESANLFWDNTNGRLGIGTNAPSGRIHVKGSVASEIFKAESTIAALYAQFVSTDGAGEFGIYTDAFYFQPLSSLANGTRFLNGANTVIMQLAQTGNVLINTTTDAGYKLDVNGTARFVGNVTNNGNVTFRDNLNIADTGQIYRSSGPIALQSFAGVGNNQSVLINMPPGSTSISNVAILAASSTTKGFLPPRMTTTEKNAIASPLAGLMVYDTTLNLMSVYNGTTWITL